MESSGTNETDEEKIMSIMESIMSNGVTKQTIARLINKVIRYSANDISSDDKVIYCLTDDEYETLYNNGGLYIDFKYNLKM